MKYQRRITQVDAIQFIGDVGLPEIVALDLPCVRPDDTAYDVLIVSTKAGHMMAWPGDWIVRGDDGKMWVVEKDTFPTLYEPVEEKP